MSWLNIVKEKKWAYPINLRVGDLEGDLNHCLMGGRQSKPLLYRLGVSLYDRRFILF